MKKKFPNRIVEIRLYKSKKNPKYAHAVATIHPCDHKEYLGVVIAPKVMKDYQSLLVNSVRIWKPNDYEIAEKHYCQKCPSDLIWIKDLPTVNDLEDAGIEE